MHLSKSLELELRNFSLLSCCAAYLRENVARRSHTIGTVLYPQSFTVRELKVGVQTFARPSNSDHLPSV
jgi:hypothetical protein